MKVEYIKMNKIEALGIIQDNIFDLLTEEHPNWLCIYAERTELFSWLKDNQPRLKWLRYTEQHWVKEDYEEWQYEFGDCYTDGLLLSFRIPNE